MDRPLAERVDGEHGHGGDAVAPCTSPANARATASARITAAISHGERLRANSRRASERVLTSRLCRAVLALIAIIARCTAGSRRLRAPMADVRALRGSSLQLVRGVVARRRHGASLRRDRRRGARPRCSPARPFNVVELDLPEAPEGRRPLRARRRDARGMDPPGHPRRRPRGGALGRSSRSTTTPTAAHTRRGFLCRVRVADYGPGEVRPHERTQPGPKEDRLRLTRATRHNLSPIFSLHEGNAWPILEPALDGDPWARSGILTERSTASGGCPIRTSWPPSPPSWRPPSS